MRSRLRQGCWIKEHGSLDMLAIPTSSLCEFNPSIVVLEGNDGDPLDISKTEDGVAVQGGTIYYILNGKLHREDGPAVEYAGGTKEWYINGEFHREPAGKHVEC